MSPTSPSKRAPKSKNWLLAKSRQWHAWSGVIAALFLLITGASGIVLNYKKPILTALGLETELPRGDKKPPGQPHSATVPSRFQTSEKPTIQVEDGGRSDSSIPSFSSLPSVRKTEANGGNGEGRAGNSQSVSELGQHRLLVGSGFTTASGLNVAAIGIDRVLELARLEWGEAPLERIELKDERGELIYKVKRRGGPELWLNAATGSHFVKGEYEKPMKPGEAPARQFDWGKLILDLHTGKIGGEPGKAIVSMVALGLLFLSVSGLYLWVKPLLIRRQNAKARGAMPLPAAAAITQPSAHTPPGRAAARQPAGV